jgi:phosphate:Na+ symporter
MTPQVHTPGIDLLVELLGAVALLLWGVRLVRTGMTRSFGGQLRRIIASCGRHQLKAFGSGVMVAGVLQSSTATALLLSSFTANGLISLPVALAVMLGADVGSTFAAQLLSVSSHNFSALMVFIGVAGFMSSDSEPRRGMARIFLGFGLMLLALALIKQAALPLNTSPTFLAVLSGLREELLLALLISAAVTWLMHSSLAMVLLVMSFANLQLISPALALAMVLGANIGGALAPLITQWASPASARRVPMANLLIRCVTAALILPWLGDVQRVLMWLSAQPDRMAVNFHLAFNLLAALLFLPLTAWVARKVTELMPDPPNSQDLGRAIYLDPALVQQTADALACAMRETLRLGDLVAEMLRRSLEVFDRDDQKLAKEIVEQDDAVDRLHEAIKLYLIQVSKHEMSQIESQRQVEILSFIMNLEHVGDIIDKNLMELASKKMRNKLSFSQEGMAEIGAFHQLILDNMRLSFNVFATRDVALARRLIAEKSRIREAELRASESHFERLRQGRMESLETSAIHMDVIRDLKRINSHLTSVAYPVLEYIGEISVARNKEPAGILGAPH